MGYFDRDEWCWRDDIAQVESSRLKSDRIFIFIEARDEYVYMVGYATSDILRKYGIEKESDTRYSKRILYKYQLYAVNLLLFQLHTYFDWYQTMDFVYDAQNDCVIIKKKQMKGEI